MNGKLIYWIMGVLVSMILFLYGAWMNSISSDVKVINDRSLGGYQRLSAVEESLKGVKEDIGEIKDYLRSKGWDEKK